MAKPKLCLIPSAVGDGALYSVLPSSGVGDFDFSRNGGAATRVNAQGFIETVDNNTPRLNYPLIDGVVSGCPSLLLEPQRTNLITYSEDFSNAYWTKYDTSINSNQGISPDGSINSDKVVEDTGTSTHQVGRLFSFSSGTTYSVSVFVKYNGRNLQIAAGNTGTWAGNVKFDLENGVVLSEINGTGKIKKLGNGWFKCTVIGVALATASTNINFGLLNNETLSYTGDGTSGVYLWGAQLEANSYPTSYIPSLTGSQTTRSAETCNNAGNANTFNDSEGVLFAEISALVNDETFRLITLSNGTIYNRLTFYYGNASNQIRFWVVSSGTTSTLQDTSLFDVTLSIKIALKYKENDFALWINGSEVLTANSGATPIGLDRITFAEFDGTGNPFYGNTKQLQYFDKALTDTDLEELTSWTSFNEMATAQQYSIL